MNKFKKAAASICAVIALCPLLNVSADFTEKQNNCPDFSQIKNVEYNRSGFDKAYDALEKIAKNGNKNKFGEVEKLLLVLMDEYDHMQTMANIYGINYYADVTNRDVNKRLSDIQQIQFEFFDDMTQCIIDLYYAGFEDELRDVSGVDLIDIFLEDTDEGLSDEEYEKLLEKNNSLIQKSNDIVNEYYGYTENDFSVEYNGKTWILNDLFDNPPEDEDDYKEISKLIYSKRNNTLGNLYLQLLDVRSQIAQLHGYDNYAEYAYEELYITDYTTDDTDKIYDNVKKYFSENYEYITDESSNSVYFSGLYDMAPLGDEILDTIEPFFNQVDSEISERFNHLKSHHLYDIDDSGVKSGDSFTDSLFDYSVPFLFVTPTGDYNDIITVIHEFGHANAEYAKPSTAVENELGSSLDTSEMHSQGMEVLFTHYSKQILGEEKGEAFNQMIVKDLFDSIIQGCLFDEFQKYAYRNPGCTLEQLNAKYKELSDEYGMEYSEDNPYLYDWVEVTHNYDSPMYYITYATSAVSVLDLWIQSMDNMDNAVNMYKNIVNCDMYTPYKETAKSCGLATIFDEEDLEEISYQIEYYFDNGMIDNNYISAAAVYQPNSSLAESSLQDSSALDDNSSDIPKTTYYKTHHSEHNINQAKAITHMVFIPLAFASVAYLIGLVIAILVVRHSDKKRREQKNDDSSMYV